MSVAASKDKSPGKDWFDGFMKRHPDLSIRKPEKLTTARARMLNPVVVTNYFNDLDALLDKLDLKEKPDNTESDVKLPMVIMNSLNHSNSLLPVFSNKNQIH